MPIDAEERLIARPTLHDQVVEQLREMIVEAELVPGDRVDEKALCAVFGISRTPLREALKVLASEGARHTRLSAITGLVSFPPNCATQPSRSSEPTLVAARPERAVSCR